jgi:hypothetical protein
MNGHFQVSEFNVSLPAMNLKSGRSPVDPNPSIEFLQTGHSAKYRFFELLEYKADVSGLNLSAKNGQSRPLSNFKNLRHLVPN